MVITAATIAQAGGAYLSRCTFATGLWTSKNLCKLLGRGWQVIDETSFWGRRPPRGWSDWRVPGGGQAHTDSELELKFHRGLQVCHRQESRR